MVRVIAKIAHELGLLTPENLKELMPASLNRAKSDKVTERARVFAKELYDAKLLSEEVLRRP